MCGISKLDHKLGSALVVGQTMLRAVSGRA